MPSGCRGENAVYVMVMMPLGGDHGVVSGSKKTIEPDAWGHFLYSLRCFSGQEVATRGSPTNTLYRQAFTEGTCPSSAIKHTCVECGILALPSVEVSGISGPTGTRERARWGEHTDSERGLRTEMRWFISG
jgi:hypothetical protein